MSQDNRGVPGRFPLARANNLVREGMLWSVAARKRGRDFGYSDGSTHEVYLKNVLAQARDLSSLSDELEAAIRDWPSEYHLSSKRANLLRGMDFSSMSSVLELGCGCGAISRYLGEAGLKVDAIEGSPVRAELAALRCADLSGVNIVNANFNDLALPAGAYDAVFLVGVLEYASRFSSDSRDDRDAVLAILGAVRGSLKPGGVVIIAIENRLGLKYLLGANEDHYGQPMVGIYNYPVAGGIRTYDYRQWQAIIDQAGFRAQRCYLPFPDYKVPTVILSEEFAAQDPRASAVLASVRSRDYLKALEHRADESALWDGIHQAGVLPEFSNSYLWVLGDEVEGVGCCGAIDFAHFGGESRRRCYKTVTIKPAGRDRVEKRRLANDSAPADATVTQVVESSDYLRGSLLSEAWSRSVSMEPRLDALLPLIRQYYDFLKQCAAKAVPLYDLLPSNIVDCGQDGLRIFDNEWRTPDPVEPEFTLYRALAGFCAQNQQRLAPLFEAENLQSIEEFILACGGRLGLELRPVLSSFVARDDAIQRCIHRDDAAVDSLNLLQGRPGATSSPAFFHPRLYWAGPNRDFAEERSLRKTAGIGQQRQDVVFDLEQVGDNLRYIRFDPAEQQGYFHIYSIELQQTGAAGKVKSLLVLGDEEAIRRHAVPENMVGGSGGLGSAWYASTNDPHLVIDLDGIAGLDGNEPLRVRVTMDWPRSSDYLLIRNEYARREVALGTQLEAATSEVERLRALEVELGIIKGSRVWRMAEKLRRVFYFGLLKKLPFWQNLMLSVSRSGLRPTLGRLRSLATGAGGLRGAASEVANQETDYERFAKAHFPDPAQLAKMARQVTGLGYRPRISVLIPVYNADPGVLDKAVQSVIAQVYGNWELCIVDDASTRNDTVGYLKALHHPRIRIRYLERNRNIAGASNAAAELADGEYLALLDNDDELEPHALYEVVAELNRAPADIVYSDEDFIDLQGRRANPHFKPDFSPHLLLSHNYVTHLMVFRRSLFQEVGGFRSGYDGAQDYDLMLRMSERTQSIRHIPKVLYHWRMAAHSTSYDSDAKPGALVASRAAIEDALARRGIAGTVWNANMPHFYRVRPELPDEDGPLVSIVIPFRDRPDLLRTCITSIRDRSSYRNYEIIGVSNASELPDTFELMKQLGSDDSRIRFVECNEPFNFSRLVNRGVAEAHGEQVILLNNDIEVISWDWIEAMLELSRLPDVGVVGAKLFYPDNTVQHAGIIVGIGGYAGHAHKNFQAGRHGYFNRLHVIHNVSAVTGACMMVKKVVFEEAGGFDEKHLGVACNDVDFCLRVRELGYWTVFTPYAELYHFESKSRGYEDTVAKQSRFEREKAWFRERHAAVLENGDPFYNPNLSLDAEDFRLRT